jgi:hypothetical protein
MSSPASHRNGRGRGSVRKGQVGDFMALLGERAILSRNSRLKRSIRYDVHGGTSEGVATPCWTAEVAADRVINARYHPAPLQGHETHGRVTWSLAAHSGETQ